MTDSKRKANSQGVGLVFGEHIARQKVGLKHHSPSMKKDYQERPFLIGDNGDLAGKSAFLTY